MKRALPLFLVLALGAPGCATTQVVATEAGSGTPVAAAQDEGSMPSVELSSEVLYELLLADIAARRGHFDVSVNLYSRLATSTRDPRLAERATRVAVFARQQEEALQAAELWVQLEPENLEARQLVTALYIRADRPNEAVPHVEKILASSEASSENGFMVVAGLLSREKDKRAALDLMGRVTATRKDNPDALFAYSHLAARLGEWKLAGEAIDQVLVLRPGWDQAIVQKSQILRSEGKTDQALEVLRQAVADKPESVDFRLVYARLLVDEERFGDAYEQFRTVNELQGDNDDALFALGFLALELGKLDEAEKYLTELKTGGTRGDEVNYYLGRLEEARGNDQAAQRWFGSIGDGEHYINAQIRIIVLKAKGGDLAGARALVDSLRVQRPGQKLRLYLVEGEILAEAEKYQDAYKTYTKALEEFADNADLLYSRAMAAEKLDQLDAMEQDLRKILARNPNNAEALNALGYTLADRTTRYEEALELVKRALELRPSDFYIVDSLGWIYYRLGDHEKAVKYLRRAFELKADPEVAAHLGEVLWVTGDKEGARAVWQQAIQADPKGKSKVITEVMERLDAK